MPRLLVCLLALVVVSQPVRSDDGIPPDTLKALKAATVFVKVQAGTLRGSGSGFLLQVEGDTALVVTNEHVIKPPRPGLPPATISLVFHSGRKEEKVVPAELVAADSDRDLAILRIKGFKDLPRPIERPEKLELTETMGVYLVGFPFGHLLSTTKGNPAITIGKGTISSLRENERGDLALIQIDGDLNPGNSGGPVVDGKGRLVGVAVARIRESRIGLAIPPGELTKMLHGRIGAIRFKTLKVAEGVAEYQVELTFIDPLNKIRSAAVHYVRTDKLPGKPARDKDGKWPPLPGSEKVKLKIAGQRGLATLRLTGSDKKVSFSFQPTYVNGEGKTIFAEPRPRTSISARSRSQLPPCQSARRPSRSKAMRACWGRSAPWTTSRSWT